MPVYEFLTLTDLQASALVDACNGSLLSLVDPDYASEGDPRQEIALCLNDAEADGLGAKWGISTPQLAAIVLGLSLEQGRQLQRAIVAFWDSAGDDWGLNTREILSEVGLV